MVGCAGVIAHDAPASGTRDSVLEILNAMSNVGDDSIVSVNRCHSPPQTVVKQPGFITIP
jgi:hypothetical protein